MKYDTYTAVRPNGEIETFKAPSFFDPFEIADRLRHSLVYLHIKPKFSVLGFDCVSGLSTAIYGPAYTLIYEREHYRVDELPADDGIALDQWKQIKAISDARQARQEEKAAGLSTNL